MVVLSKATTTTTFRPRPPIPLDNDKLSTATGTGSYFEYAVRNVIRNAFYFPRADTSNHISELEQMVFYYHLQMMHIDLLWTQNWQRINPKNSYPSIFELPSRSARYFYNEDIKYVFGDGRQRTLDSHRLICDECNRMYNCNVNHIHSHNVNKFFRNDEMMYERRTTVPYFEVALENMSRSANLPYFVSTNEVADVGRNRPLASTSSGNYHCAAAPVWYLPKVITSTMRTTTEDEWERFEKKYRYDIERDELKKK